MTEVRCPIACAADLHPDAPAIIGAQETLTYRAYDDVVSAMAAHLEAGEGSRPREPKFASDPRRAGTRALPRWRVRRGDVVGVVSPACPDVLIALMALFRMGAIACLIDPRWPGKAIADALSRAKCTRVIAPLGRYEGEGSRPREPEGEGSRPREPEGEGSRPREPESESDLRRAGTRALPVLPLEDIIRCHSDCARHGSPTIDLEQPATILFTSGSAGIPKPALHAYGNHHANAAASNRNIAVSPGDRWLLSLGLHHVAGTGIVFRCMLAGAAVAVPEPGRPLEETLAQYAVTHVSLVATQLYRLLRSDEGRRALAGLKAILLGGSAIPESLIRRAYECGLPIFTSYGLTEMASQVSTTRPGDALESLLTSGKPLIPGNVRLAEDGEILVRGNALFLGYITPQGVERPVTPDGWFSTGDIGAFDAEGNLIVCGRKDNCFVSGGENIQPEEIERCLCRIPPVTEAVVVPVEDEEFGEVPVAFVNTEAGAVLDPEDLRRELAEELPRYKIPKQFLPWPLRAGTSDAKTDRRALRALAQTSSHKPSPPDPNPRSV